MPTFSTLDAKLLNDAIGTVNDNLTVHHKENATTLSQICKDLGEHFTGHIYAFDRIEKKLNTIIERLSPPATFSFIPHNQGTPIPDATWQTPQTTPAQDLRDTAELFKQLAEHGHKPFVSKPNQFNIHHNNAPSFQESNGVQGEPCQSDQVSELESYRNKLQLKDVELQKLQNHVRALEVSNLAIAKTALKEHQEKEALQTKITELEKLANRLLEDETEARQQLFHKSQELENLHQAYNKEVQKLSETLNVLAQERNKINKLEREKEELRKELEEEGEELEKYFKLYNELRHTAQKQVDEQFAEIQQLKDTIVKMQMEKHSSIVSVVSGRSPQSNEDQTSK